MHDIQKKTNLKMLKEHHNLYKEISTDELQLLFEQFSVLAGKKTKDKEQTENVIDFHQFSQLIGEYVLNLASTDSKDEEGRTALLMLLFQTNHRKEKTTMNWIEFLAVFVPLTKGTPRQQFDLCYHLLYTDEDKILVADLSFVLSLWYRMTNIGLCSLESSTVRIKAFVAKLFERIREEHKEEKVTYQDFAPHMQEIGKFWDTLCHSTYS